MPADGLVVMGDAFSSPAEQAAVRAYLVKVGQMGIPFAGDVAKNVLIKELELYVHKTDGKTQAKLTCEIVVTLEMTNGLNTMHGGCAVFLVDACSAAALGALAVHLDKTTWDLSVSQAINATFHAPAPLGATLHIVNFTKSFGSRTVSTLTEIWDMTNKRLCVSAVHNKMIPAPKPRL